LRRWAHLVTLAVVVAGTSAGEVPSLGGLARAAGASPPYQLAFTVEPPASVALRTTFPLAVDVESTDGERATAVHLPISVAFVAGAARGASLRCRSDPVRPTGGVARFECAVTRPGLGFQLTATAPAVDVAQTVSLPFGVTGAVALPTGAMDARFCSDYGQTGNGSYAAIRACNGSTIGAIRFRGRGGARVASDVIGFQCVELVQRYLYEFERWAPEQYDGADLVRVYGAAHHVRPVRSGNALGRTPEPGDVISFSVFGDFTDHDHAFPGHTALVVQAGRGYVLTLNENWDGGASLARLAVRGTTVGPVYTGSRRHGEVLARYSEWLPLTITAPPGGYGPFYVAPRALPVHAAPSSTSDVVARLAAGSAVHVSCQTIGSAYATGSSPGRDAVWDELSTGGYVATFFVSAPSLTSLSPGVARC
jgi:hypothetical protein